MTKCSRTVERKVIAQTLQSFVFTDHMRYHIARAWFIIYDKVSVLSENLDLLKTYCSEGSGGRGSYMRDFAFYKVTANNEILQGTHWYFVPFRLVDYLDRVKRIWYLSPMRAAMVQASLRIRTVSPEPPLLAHTSSESRGTFRQKARSLAPLNGWACAVKICHDGMLEDTNSLDTAQLIFFEESDLKLCSSKQWNRRMIRWVPEQIAV